MHPRNIHQESYDFKALIETLPALEKHVLKTKGGNLSIDFFNPEAVKLLNKALLVKHYNISTWDIPKAYLCPPIPGRVDYIHYLADLLAEGNKGKIPKGNKVKCLDIGTGSSVVYPLLGNAIYGWSFIATEIEDKSLIAANRNISENGLDEVIELRKQMNSKFILKDILNPKDKIDLVMCNPPFHGSEAEASEGSKRKNKNLKQEETLVPQLNFGGKHNELWYPGGEKNFIKKLIFESSKHKEQCKWFTCLISKKDTVYPVKKALKKIGVKEQRFISIKQGNKASRFVAWQS